MDFLKKFIGSMAVRGAIIFLAFMISMESCKIGPHYTRAKVVDDSWTWKNQTLVDTMAITYEHPVTTPKPVTSDSFKLDNQWWKVFADDTLNDLMDKAFQSNPTLQIAAGRIMEAQGQTLAARANYYPLITVDPFINRNRLSGNRPSPVSTGRLNPLTITTISLPLDMAYEFDVWGKFRRGVESAKATMVATEADLQVIKLGLATNLAVNYFMLRLADSQIQLFTRSLKLRHDNLNLTRSQYNSGIATQLDVSQAEIEAYTVETQLIDAKRTRALSENAIAVLCGIPTMNLTITPRSGLPVVPYVPLEVPSDLLEKRPDVVEAEQQVVSANAQIGVAEAAYLPSVKLSAASAGFLSSRGGNLFDDGSFGHSNSTTWIGGVIVSIPVFTGGRLKSQKDIAIARTKEAQANYQQVVLTAFREVQDALANIQFQTEQSVAQQKVVTAARTTASLSKELYKSGLTTYINVIIADRSVLDAENGMIAITGQRLFNSISLVKALGGGWNGSSLDDEKK